MQASCDFSGDWWENVALQYEWCFCLLQPDISGGLAARNQSGPCVACRAGQDWGVGTDKAGEVSHAAPAKMSRLPEAIDFRKESASGPHGS